MDCNIYYGSIIRGDLHGALRYVRQFPDQAELYDRLMARFAQEQPVPCNVDEDLRAILLAYQQYYRDVFYCRVDQDTAADALRERLLSLLNISDAGTKLCELEQHQLVELFAGRGLHFLGGKTSGYYDPYVWRTTDTVSYEVELPGGVRSYTVKLLDGFLTRGWIDHLSLGEIGAGGWADGDGIINCVKSAWDVDSESFRVSLLKHEAQHASDQESGKVLTPETLEYRAKLVELIYSTERNLLQAFAQEADDADASNGHAMAASRIVKGFAEVLGEEDFDPAALPIEQIQRIATQLFVQSETA